MNHNCTTHSMRRRSNTDQREISRSPRVNPRSRAPEPSISLTVGQLEAMLAAAKAKEAGREGA